LSGIKGKRGEEMKSSLKYFIISLALLGFLTGCEIFMGPGEPGAGNVTLQFGSGDSARSISQAVIDTLRYEVEFRGPGGQALNRSVPAGTGTVNLSLALGEWAISAEAYSPGDILAGTGSAAITVIPEMSPVIISMNEAASMSARAITAFTITSPVAATGIINETLHTVTIDAPFGTAVNNMTTSITHNGEFISPASGEALDFTSPVTYTVTAADGTTQAYTVTVNVAAADAKAITAFTITSPAAAGVINETLHTVTIDMPYGTVVTSLTPTITITGASISPASGEARDFSGPVTYTVTAADGTTQAYTVTVNVAANNAKAITGFSFASPAATGTITEGTKTIAVTAPYGTALTSLTPTITITGTSISPASGTAQNFTGPVPYTVQAGDGSTQVYTVTVIVRGGYLVGFDAGSGTLRPGTSDQTILPGGKVSAPAYPMPATGYGFDGWYTGPGGAGTKWVFDTATVTADMTLYAKWLTTAEMNTADFGVPSATQTFNVTSNDELNTAISDIVTENNSSGFYVINVTGNFDRPGTGTRTFNISGPTVSIRGGGTITLSSSGALFYLHANALTLRDITLTGRSGNGASIVRVPSGVLTMHEGALLTGNVNSSGNGGGVLVDDTFGTGSFTMKGGTISGNTATRGGGVTVAGSGVTFNMSGGTISGNTAGYEGGGVEVNTGGIFNKTGGIIYGKDGGSNSNTVTIGMPLHTGGDTDGHAVIYDGGGSNIYYRDTTLGTGINISTSDTLPGSSGVTLGSWTKQ
jgi:uncharacterized repeat protein (TIGR02543 family)